MMTLRQCAAGIELIPAATSWYLADLGEARGKQELFTRQSPQTLKVLREQALIESAVSSNRIEGVVADQARIATIVFGRAHLRDRNEEEIRGYRDALKRIHEHGSKMRVSERTIRELHRLSRAGIGDAGRYKRADSDILETLPDGRRRIRFRTVAPARTPAFMREMVALWNECLEQRRVREFEERAGQVKAPRGTQTALVEAAINAFPGEFSLRDLERACPGVSRDMVRRVLRDLQRAGKVACLGRGPGAAWRKKGNTLKRG